MRVCRDRTPLCVPSFSVKREFRVVLKRAGIIYLVSATEHTARNNKTKTDRQRCFFFLINLDNLGSIKFVCDI